MYDWEWLDRLVITAERYQITLYLDLWHYGYPDWLDLMSPDAPGALAEFARQIALRYPGLLYYAVCNEPSLLVDYAGRLGRWRPFLRRRNPVDFRLQVCLCIIEASRAILEVQPAAQLVLPEPWHAPDLFPLDFQAQIIDIVLGRREPQLGGSSELITAIGLNHYRDSTIPPFHLLVLEARRRWPDKPLWLSETSGPPRGWQQTEWFWWMLAEVRLANLQGVGIPVFTWAPTISMYDWYEAERRLPNGIWVIAEDGSRQPNGHMIDAVRLARDVGYLR